MKTFYFCYGCGATVHRHDGSYKCLACNSSEFMSCAHMVFFNYEMTEFINPVFQESESFWWEEALVYDHGTAIFLVKLPSNYWIIPRNKLTSNELVLSSVNLEDLN